MQPVDMFSVYVGQMLNVKSGSKSTEALCL